MNQHPTLQAIDLLIDDFGVDDIANHFRDIFKNHLRASDGYDPEALADEYEIGCRIIDILKGHQADKKED